MRRAARRDAQISNAIHIAANIPRHKRQPVAGRHSRTRPRLLLPTAASRPGPPRTGKPPTARRLRAPPAPQRSAPLTSRRPPPLPAPLRADFPAEQRGRRAALQRLRLRHRFSRAAVPEARGAAGRTGAPPAAGSPRTPTRGRATPGLLPHITCERCPRTRAVPPLKRRSPNNSEQTSRELPDTAQAKGSSAGTSGAWQARKATRRKAPARPPVRPAAPASPAARPQPAGFSRARDGAGNSTEPPEPLRDGSPRGTDPTSGADAVGAARSRAVTLCNCVLITAPTRNFAFLEKRRGGPQRSGTRTGLCRAGLRPSIPSQSSPSRGGRGPQLFFPSRKAESAAPRALTSRLRLHAGAPRPTPRDAGAAPRWSAARGRRGRAALL